MVAYQKPGRISYNRERNSAFSLTSPNISLKNLVECAEATAGDHGKILTELDILRGEVLGILEHNTTYRKGNVISKVINISNKNLAGSQ